MAHIERPIKVSKLLRYKAQEFLESSRNPDILNQIINHFDSGLDTVSCLLALEMIFTNLLKDRSMYVEIIPLKPIERTPENQHKQWLKETYEGCFNLKILNCLEHESARIKLQGLSTAMNIIAHEGRHPLESKGTLENYVPLGKLKLILMKILSNKYNNTNLINKYTEYLLFDDILFFYMENITFFDSQI